MRSSPFEHLIDRKRILTSEDELLTYSYDATERRCIPRAVFRPVSEEEVQRIVRYAYEKEIPITARGAGTSLSGCAVPSEGSFVLDFTLMNRIKNVDEKNRLATVEPGVVYGRLNSYLERYGLFFPPDPGSGSVCTIGGMVSTNASGIRAVKYGTTRDYVQMLRVILADGEAAKLGNLAPKSSDGYNLISFFVGSEGTLGIVTEITLRLRWIPKYFAAASLSFDSMEGAGEAVGKIIGGGLAPSVLEIMDENTLEVVKKFQPIEVKGRAVLLLEMDGFEKEDVDLRLKRAVEICRERGARNVKVAKGAEEREKMWRARKAALPSLSRYRPTLILEDVTVPLSKLPRMLSKVENISHRHGIEIATFGHAGDGNLHPTMLVDRNNREEMAKVEDAMEELFQAALSLGGTLTGEHGIGLSKKDFMLLEHKGSLELMKKLKRAMDPKGILNPGKVF